jgi:predicted unusual protein kinase regulating ubiquinone biosynthesis (AarF/ABC1/UbiB family)
MATNLDPNFDPWTETIPFAERLAKEELQQNWRGWLQELVKFGQIVFNLPHQLERVLTEAERGSLTFQTSLAPDTRKAIRRLEHSVQQLAWTVVAVGLLISGVNFYVGSDGNSFGLWFIGAALVAFLWGIFRGN